MKKFLLALAIAATAQVSAFAQNYTVTTTTGTYADLTGSTVVSTTNWGPTQSFVPFAVPIGFNFNLNGTTFTSLEGDYLGRLIFVNGATEISVIAFDGYVVHKAALTQGSTATLSPVSYLLSGTAGSRILKVEYKNTAILMPPPTQSGNFTYNPSDVANFQVWLYEGSNKIEVHYGNTSVANAPKVFFGANGPSIAIATDLDFTTPSFSGFFLQGQASAPTITVLNNATTGYPALDGIPASGTIYAFNRVATGVNKDFTTANVSLYPNPVADVMAIKGLTAKGNVTINVTDVLGKVVLSEKVAAAQNVSVNVSNLKKGAYTVEISSAEGRSIKQIIKQ